MPTSCYRAKKKVTEHFILQLLHKQRLFLNCSSRSNGFQKQCLKYFQILAGAIPLLQQTHLKIIHKGGLCHCLSVTEKKALHHGEDLLKVTQTCQCQSRVKRPDFLVLSQLFSLTSLTHLRVKYTKTMCFAF